LLQFARYGGGQAAFGRKGITGRLHLIRRELIVRKIQLVYSNPVPGMEDEFNEWYSSRHVHEILRVPGYLSAQRFRVTRHPIGGSGDSGPEPFKYLALYEVEGDPEEILARFEEARIAGRITSSPALDPVFSGNFYEAVGEKVVQR
jgi:hypothetical protein